VIHEPVPENASQAGQLAPFQPAKPQPEFVPDGNMPSAPPVAGATNLVTWQVTLPSGLVVNYERDPAAKKRKAQLAALKPARTPIEYVLEDGTTKGPKAAGISNTVPWQVTLPSGLTVTYERKPKTSKRTLRLTLLQAAGPAREFAPEGGKPSAPTDAEFTNAAVWRITLPSGLDLHTNPLLRIHYAGDIARLILNGRLIEDNFYSGRAFDLGLKRYAPEIFTGDLELQVLPLRRDAPIYLTDKARAALGMATSVATVRSAEIDADP